MKSLFDYLAGGYTIAQFLEQFPTVSRGQAVAALELAREAPARDPHEDLNGHVVTTVKGAGFLTRFPAAC